MDPRVHPDVQGYLDEVDPERRPLFDRLRIVIEGEFPAAELGWSYKMPTFIAGSRRLYVGVWTHGLSVYGWDGDRTAPFLAAHPGLKEHKGTIKLRPADLDVLTDDDLKVLVHAALDP